MSSINKLVKKAKKGDGDAFVFLVKQYEITMYRTAKRLLRNDEDVADVMQETIISAYEKLHTLKNNAYFKTWLYKILINKCNDLLNKKKDVTEIDLHTLPQTTKSPFEKLELEDALNSLNETYKLALTLYYIVGLSIKEIGEFLDEPEGTIKSRLSRAKTILRTNYYKIEGVDCI